MRSLAVFLVLVPCLLWTACSGERGSGGESREARASSEHKETGVPGSSQFAKSAGGSKGDKEAAGQREGAEVKEDSKGLVEVSMAAQRRIGLEVTQVSITPLADVLSLTGTVQPIDSRIGRVRPLARGRLTEVLVRLGDRVRDGQVLARLDNIEAGELAAQYSAAQAELARLRIQQAVTARQAERSRNLAEIGAVPQKELEAIEAERQGQLEAIRAQESTLAGLAARLRRFGLSEPDARGSSVTTIAAPFAGVVTAVKAAPGEVVDIASELFSIADLSRVYVAGQVYEKDLGRVRIGQPATILVAAYPGLRFPGRVDSISALLDPQTRTAAVRVDVANAEERLRLDMFANLELPTATKRNVLTVPSEAIQQVEGKTVIFLRQDATHFIARPIQVGATAGRLTEVTAGLVAGEAVVTRGAFQVKSALLSKELGEKE